MTTSSLSLPVFLYLLSFLFLMSLFVPSSSSLVFGCACVNALVSYFKSLCLPEVSERAYVCVCVKIDFIDKIYLQNDNEIDQIELLISFSYYSDAN